MRALLVLEDGFSLAGNSFAGRGTVFGEVVFNTAMAGYQEMITDPSYKGQILSFTYPLVGNYGVNELDVESASPQVEALLLKECCRRPYNRRSSESLDAFLERFGVLGVEGIDTRSLTLHLRRSGTLQGVVSTGSDSPAELMARLRASSPALAEQDLVGRVTCPAVYRWDEHGKNNAATAVKQGPHVVVYDFGVKYNILRRLSERGCRVSVVPAATAARDVLAMQPDGVLLSNGPGDPADLAGLLPEVRALLGRLPLFGICLGHQVLGLALGYKTYKLPFGHRGANHPVKELSSGRVLITSQNHGYCVDLAGARSDTKATHVNLNDGTLEGMESESLRCFSVQFHPEASPGPREAAPLFDRFVNMLAVQRKEEDC
ncbi:MAG: glutamine-hydrolyzing carbamoyl-phosphate synthase small subunit [Bacillota bacterium]